MKSPEQNKFVTLSFKRVTQQEIKLDRDIMTSDDAMQQCTRR
jgi:hypothetical protein